MCRLSEFGQVAVGAVQAGSCWREVGEFAPAEHTFSRRIWLGMLVVLAGIWLLPSTVDAQAMLVVSNEAEVFAGDEPLRRVAPGTVVHVRKIEGPWRLTPRQGGWMKADHLQPLVDALKRLDQQLQTQPTAVAHHHRGIVLVELNRFDEALQAFDAAGRLKLDSAALHVNRGNALQQLGRSDEAIMAYTRAIELDPADARAFDNRSSVLVEKGQLEAALADADQAIAVDPDYPEAYNNRGVIRRLQSDFEAAVADYSQAIKLHRWYAEAYANRGYAFKRLQRFAEALRDYRLAIKLDPDFLGAQNDLAWLLATCSDASLRNAEEALQLAQHVARQSNHQNADYLDTLAAAYAASGHFTEAVKWQSAAIKLLPADQRPAAQARKKLFQSQQPFHEPPQP